MAIIWSATHGDSAMKVGVEVTQSPATVDASTTQVTLTFKYWAAAAYAIADNQTLFVGSPFWEQAASYHMTQGQRHLATRTKTYSLIAGQAQSVKVYARIDGLYSGGTPTVEFDHAIPARPIVAPLAPTSPSAVRQTDTHAVVIWTNNSTSSAPWENVIIQRFDGVSWVEVAVIVGWATGWNDYGVQPNKRYQYSIRAWNAAGGSPWAFTGFILNTPSAPTGAAVVKTGATSARVSWSDASQSETGFEIQRSTDGGATWAAAGTATENATSFIDSAVPAGSVVYRVRAVAGSLASAWSAKTNAITTSTPPAAPTVTALPAHSLTDRPLTLTWLHNSIDGSAQTKAEVEINGAVTTITGATSTLEHTPELGTLRARVRTWGGHATAGPWSAFTETQVVNPPAVAISVPPTDGTIIADLPLVVTWLPSSQSSFDLTLKSGGQRVATWSGTTATTQNVTNLRDGTSYTLDLSIRDQHGFDVSTSRSFTTEFVPPATPILHATFDPVTGSTSLLGLSGADGAVATVGLALYRDEGDESTVVADPLAPGAMVIDHTPRLGQVVHYRLAARAANGATAEVTTEVATGVSGRFFLNFGPGFTDVASIDLNVSHSAAPRRSKSLFHFAGRAQPSAFYGEQATLELSLSGDLFDDPVREAAFRALAHAPADAIYRTPRGDRHRVSADVDLSEGVGPRITAVDVSMVEVAG